MAMIQAAHIGIGIVGKEGAGTLSQRGLFVVNRLAGLQASLAADVSITEFQHTGLIIKCKNQTIISFSSPPARLLLWHGRNAYSRTSHVANFVFHRGLIISVIQVFIFSQPVFVR